MVAILNIVLGIIPTLALATSVASGVEDDKAHRRVFLLVYGLWAFTLAGWNWLDSSHVAWIVLWGVFGVIAMALWIASRKR